MLNLLIGTVRVYSCLVVEIIHLLFFGWNVGAFTPLVEVTQNLTVCVCVCCQNPSISLANLEKRLTAFLGMHTRLNMVRLGLGRLCEKPIVR